MIEGCIVNTIKRIVDLYDEDFQYYKNFTPVNWWDVNTWDFQECTCATPQYINTYFNQQRFFDKLEYMENAQEILNRLKDRYEIVIVSMGYSPNLRAKAIWIEKNMPYAKFIGVNFKEYADKSHIDMSDGIYIDDNAKNLNTNAIENICYGDIYDWNKDWTGKRCFNWSDLEKYIEGVNLNDSLHEQSCVGKEFIK